MPESGSYLFTSVGFSSNEEPFLLLQKNELFLSFNPIGKVLTLAFDVSDRYCTGWKDITAGERFVCPTGQQVSAKYEQCPACQKRTGFNPAFYHATTVSLQQEARNAEPHVLYLAHFGPGVVKVGISHALRGNARLLEQGARSALILDTFSSVHIARQYEALIAKLPNVVETVQMRKKLEQMTRTYDTSAAKQALENTKSAIEASLGVTFSSQPVQSFDNNYFPGQSFNMSESFSTADQHMISGDVTGLLGTVLICTQAGKTLFLPLKQYAGYTVSLSDAATNIDMPAQQTSLF